MHVKKGDVVQVISGNDRGKIGEIKRALPREDRVVVEGVNLRWRNHRPTEQHPKGQRIQEECSIHVSNVRHTEAQEPKASAKASKGQDKQKSKKKG